MDQSVRNDKSIVEWSEVKRSEVKGLDTMRDRGVFGVPQNDMSANDTNIFN